MDTEFISHAKALAEALRKQRQDCVAEIAEIQARLVEYDRKLGALDVLLAGTEIVIPESNASATFPAVTENADREDMTDKVRDLLREADTYGVRPRDITAGLLRAGLRFSAQYASNALYRLKGRGEITEYHGRYYWKGFEPPSAREDQQQTGKVL